ncbi:MULTISPECIES: hypothetical protein [unclassified Moorena]|uniref:hypothetical protein n=1 Tax=unclassified Moorena TaxID=2683338 RepID=UPI0013C9A83A|nr:MULTISPECIES: hypothetical protein [unclassified Moorena]NES42784.1 hypothetical protein [Moorena sp. SIO2C4]
MLTRCSVRAATRTRLSTIVGIFDNSRALLKLALSRLSQIAEITNSKRFSPFVAVASSIGIIPNCWNFR